MALIPITTQQCEKFPGGWSVKSDQMYFALSRVRYEGVFKILEFGAGVGTTVLAELLDELKVPYQYVSYENNPKYVCAHPKVQTIMWKAFPTKLVPGKFDLIIIDGPAGLNRVKWYPMLKNRVRNGTILIVDDFRHFVEFPHTLRHTFRHSVIRERADKKIPGKSRITWLVTQVTGLR